MGEAVLVEAEEGSLRGNFFTLCDCCLSKVWLYALTIDNKFFPFFVQQHNSSVGADLFNGEWSGPSRSQLSREQS
ncbi:hypothetical protein Bca4012_042376 [Brassica carinata]